MQCKKTKMMVTSHWMGKVHIHDDRQKIEMEWKSKFSDEWNTESVSQQPEWTQCEFIWNGMRKICTIFLESYALHCTFHYNNLNNNFTCELSVHSEKLYSVYHFIM